MKIGLSLSLCIEDIINGKVEEDEVICIIAGTAIHTEEDFEYVLKNCMKNYWNNDYYAESLMKKFWKKGLIIQHRLRPSNSFPLIVDGHWIDISFYGE